MTVDDILKSCAEIQAEYGGPFLVGFEVDTRALEILKSLPREELATAALLHGITGIPVRHSWALRPNIVVPILRDRNGEETWGKPFSIGELGDERAGGKAT